MNRRRAKELLPIIKAFANGEEIQIKMMEGRWSSGEDFTFNSECEYRIKPKQRTASQIYMDAMYPNNAPHKSLSNSMEIGFKALIEAVKNGDLLE